MRIEFLTQDDPLYILPFFDEFLRNYSTEFEILQIFLLPDHGKKIACSTIAGTDLPVRRIWVWQATRQDRQMPDAGQAQKGPRVPTIL